MKQVQGKQTIKAYLNKDKKKPRNAMEKCVCGGGKQISWFAFSDIKSYKKKVTSQIQRGIQWKRCGGGSNDSWPGWPHSGPINLFAPMRDQTSLRAPSTSHNNDKDDYHHVQIYLIK